MSKRTDLDYPELDNETIKVTGFLNLKSATMKTEKITVLVGEQAAGKSILAKLQYFFWKYQSDLFHEEILSKKTIAGYSRDKVDEFFELFSVTINPPDKFKIEYENNDIEICIERTETGYKPKITISPFLEKLYMKAKRAHIKHSKIEREYYKIIREGNKIEYEKYKKISNSYHKLRSDLDKFNAGIPDVLYVPAARSFFLTIEDNIFALLATETESLEPLIVQFGKFYARAKRAYERRGMTGLGKNGRSGAQDIKDILKGDFIKPKDKYIIRASWGDVELRNASSGQKEALPLILSLLYFPSAFQRSDYSVRMYPSSVKKNKNKNKLIIIEEPEAHLFPTAQRVLVKMIADVVRKEKCKVMIATHSPYIPACVNNEIKIAENDDDSLDVTAYHISDGTAEDVYYKKYNLINVNKLDEASTQIAKEYCEQIAKAKKRLKNKSESLG